MNPIRENLADLAEEVSTVDLYHRALRTSRRLGWTRAAIAGTAALVVVAALGVAGMTVRGHQRALPPVAPTVSTTPPDPPAPSVKPPPEVTTPPPSPGSAGDIDTITLGPRTATGEPTLTGRLFLLSADAVVELSSFEARSNPLQGQRRGNCALNTLTVSPDGSLAAFVRGDRDDFGQEIVVTDLSTLTTTVIPSPAWCGGRTLWFTPDSASVVFYRAAQQGNGTTRLDPPQRYRLADGQLTAATAKDTEVSGGGFSAAKSGDTVVVHDANGAEVHRCTRPTGTAPEVLVSLSADGRYASTAPRPGDSSNPRKATKVVDTTTCQDRAVPAGGQIIDAVLFAAGGRLVVIMRPSGGSYHARLLGTDLATVADAALPGTLAGYYQPVDYIG